MFLQTIVIETPHDIPERPGARLFDDGMGHAYLDVEDTPAVNRVVRAGRLPGSSRSGSSTRTGQFGAASTGRVRRTVVRMIRNTRRVGC